MLGFRKTQKNEAPKGLPADYNPVKKPIASAAAAPVANGQVQTTSPASAPAQEPTNASLSNKANDASGVHNVAHNIPPDSHDIPPDSSDSIVGEEHNSALYTFA